MHFLLSLIHIFILFKEIKRFYKYRELLGMRSFLLNTVGNVICFMPFGFILPIISRRGKKWYNTFLLSFLMSFGIETIQLIFKVGSFDVDVYKRQAYQRRLFFHKRDRKRSLPQTESLTVWGKMPCIPV